MDDATPAFNKDAFNCPHCSAFAEQRWFDLLSQRVGGGYRQEDEWFLSACTRCRKSAMWHAETMLHPGVRLGPQPHADMPADVTPIYEEAREVSAVSKKSAAALLRLALQVLVDDLEPGSGTINDKIGALVKKGLDPCVQQAMDVLRVVGNNAVHPGQIDLEADDALLPALFGLLNLIVEQVITRPKMLAGLFGSLPQTAQDGVARRDGLSP